MNIHKNTRLTLHSRQAIWREYTQEKQTVTSLAKRYHVSRVTIYKVLKAARLRLLAPQKSTNNRFYGMKRLAKISALSKRNLSAKPNATTSPIPVKWCMLIPRDSYC